MLLLKHSSTVGTKRVGQLTFDRLAGYPFQQKNEYGSLSNAHVIQTSLVLYCSVVIFPIPIG
jgi:hypothetical protein